MKLNAVRGTMWTFFLAMLLCIALVILPAAEADTTASTKIWCQEPVALAFDGANIWVADGGVGQWSFVHQIRAHDGVHLRTIPLPEYSRPNDIILDGERIWVSCFDNAGVFEICTPKCARARRTYVAFSYGVFPEWLVPTAMAFDGTYLWVADWVHDVVARTNLETRSCMEWADIFYMSEGSSPSDLIFDGENIWVCNYGSNAIMKINASAEDLSGSEDPILEIIPVIERPSNMGCDGESIWVTHGSADVLTKIGISGSSTSAISLPEGSNPNALVFDRVNMWVANAGDWIPGKPSSVMKFRRDGTLLDTFTLGVGDHPTDLVFDGSENPLVDGSYVWVACSEGHYLKRLPASEYEITLEVSGMCSLSSGDSIKHAEVRLYSHWRASWQVLGLEFDVFWFELAAVGQTDENGGFVFEIPWAYHKECMPPANPPGTVETESPIIYGVHAEVLSRNEAADVRFWDGIDLKHASDPPRDETLTYAIVLSGSGGLLSTIEEAIATGRTRVQVDLGYAEPDWSKEGAFEILNTIGNAWDFLVNVETDLPYLARPPPVIVAWSRQIGEINQCVDASGIGLMLQICDPERLRAVQHEYGHYLAKIYNFDASPGGQHDQVNDKFAWSEGWADFFHDYVSHVCHGEPFYYDWEESPPIGSGNEDAVRQLLRVVCVEFGFNRIWDVCYNHAWRNGVITHVHEYWSGPVTIHDFWFHWFEQCPADQYTYELNRLTLLYQRHGISNIYTCGDWRVRTDVEFLDPGEIEPSDLALPEDADLSSVMVISANVVDGNVDPTDEGYTDIKINVGELDVETCWVYKQGVGPLDEVELTLWPQLPTTKPPGEPVFARCTTYNYVIVRLYVGDPLLGVIQDNSPPLITGTDFEGLALQDKVTLQVSSWDLSAVVSVTISIQCAQGDTLLTEPAVLTSEGKWQISLDTTLFPDGFYFAKVTMTDAVGNMGDTALEFSIRNWAAIEVLPASESNKAGRMMPVKFSLGVKASVDPARPFVQNQELTIKIFAQNSAGAILQTSTFGTTSKDYRIDPEGELYITNFRTLRVPKIYMVEIYRKDCLIDSFEFSTVK